MPSARELQEPVVNVIDPEVTDNTIEPPFTVE